MEVKPTRELEQEIERFGMAKIKWHTPFDYSLDKQVVRYDFLGPDEDIPDTIYSEKRSAFLNVWWKSYKRKYPDETVKFIEIAKLVGYGWPFPITVHGRELCVIEVSTQNGIIPDQIDLGKGVHLKKVADNTRSAIFDVSHAYSKSISLTKQHFCIPTLPDANSGRMKEFLDSYLILPLLYKESSYVGSDYHLELDLSLEHLLATIGGL